MKRSVFFCSAPLSLSKFNGFLQRGRDRLIVLIVVVSAVPLQNTVASISWSSVSPWSKEAASSIGVTIEWRLS